MSDRTLDDIIKEYLFLDSWGRVVNLDPDEDWNTDDLIELGVIINRILRERKENG